MTINFLTVFVCAVVAIIIGFVWYGPLFGKAWMKVIAQDTALMSPEAQQAMKKKMGGMIALQFLLSLISIYALARFNISLAGAFWIWFGFLMPTIGGAALWSGKSRKLSWNMFFIAAGCNLVTFLAYGYILNAWR